MYTNARTIIDTLGDEARNKWSRHSRISSTETKNQRISLQKFNQECNNIFKLGATIVLDREIKPNGTKKRQTVIKAIPENTNPEIITWNEKTEIIYAIVKDGEIVKLGGTRNGMKERWGSYLCGHCVPERISKKGTPFPGKMSVTNAHLYHTIEDGLIKGEIWQFWIWKLPVTQVTVNILGEPTTVIAQTYHAYESKIIQKYKKMTGGFIPLLCVNADPEYR